MNKKKNNTDKSSLSQEQIDAFSLETFTYQVQHLRKSGEAFSAYHQIEKGLVLWPNNLQLRQLKALALADLGATHNANNVIKQLADEGHDDRHRQSEDNNKGARQMKQKNNADDAHCHRKL